MRRFTYLGSSHWCAMTEKISKKEENWLMWHSSLGRIINHIQGSIHLGQGVRSWVHLNRTVIAKMWRIKGCTKTVSRFHFRKNTSHIRIFFVVVKNVFFTSFLGPKSDHCLPLSLTDWLTTYKLKESRKKGYFTVRLTVRIDPPPHGQQDHKISVFFVMLLRHD